jgi:hypothetical protein
MFEVAAALSNAGMTATRAVRELLQFDLLILEERRRAKHWQSVTLMNNILGERVATNDDYWLNILRICLRIPEFCGHSLPIGLSAR